VDVLPRRPALGLRAVLVRVVHDQQVHGEAGEALPHRHGAYAAASRDLPVLLRARARRHQQPELVAVFLDVAADRLAPAQRQVIAVGGDRHPVPGVKAQPPEREPLPHRGAVVHHEVVAGEGVVVLDGQAQALLVAVRLDRHDQVGHQRHAEVRARWSVPGERGGPLLMGQAHPPLELGDIAPGR